MQQNVLFRALGLAICFIPSAFPQSTSTPAAALPQVKVTFYASGHFVKSAMPGYKYGKFSGRIMDEYDQLAMLTYDHFVTFNLDPGPHTFSANSWLIPRPEAGGHLKLDLVVGKHYYIGAYLQPLLYLSKYRLEERTCQEARQENESTKALERKHIKDYGETRFISETSFPTCP